MFCRATSEVTGADSEFVICEGCGCVGGDCDDLGRSWDIDITSLTHFGA